MQESELLEKLGSLLVASATYSASARTRAVSYSDRDETDDELMHGRWGLKGIVSAVDAPNKRNLSSARVLCLFFPERGGSGGLRLSHATTAFMLLGKLAEQTAAVTRPRILARPA
jgi:hypothetical protein